MIALSLVAVASIALAFELALAFSVAIGLLVSHGAAACEEGVRAGLDRVLGARSQGESPAWKEELPGYFREDIATAAVSERGHAEPRAAQAASDRGARVPADSVSAPG